LLRDIIVWGCYVVTTRLPWLDSCIIRSLTAYPLLRVVNHPVRLHLGVRHENRGEGIAAHLWVSDTSGVICDLVSDLDSYQEITSGSVEDQLEAALKGSSRGSE
jgi:hypothetical protein